MDSASAVPAFATKDVYTGPITGINPAVEYHPDFNIHAFGPTHGDVIHVFIPEKYISYQYKPISEHHCFGSGYYAPCSDIAAMAVHHGCLFVMPRLKNAAHRRFCSVENAFEIISQPDSAYAKLAKIVDFPLDLRVRGVLVTIYIDDPPPVFVSSVHNGYRSNETKEKFQFSMRILSFNVITMYDPYPYVVSEKEYVKDKVVLPLFKIFSGSEVGIDYNPDMFLQIFSRFNVSKGLLQSFCLILFVGSEQYEIAQTGVTQFSLICHNSRGASTVLHNLDMSEFQPDANNLIKIRNLTFGPVVAIMVVPRGSRAKVRK